MLKLFSSPGRTGGFISTSKDTKKGDLFRSSEKDSFCRASDPGKQKRHGPKMI